MTPTLPGSIPGLLRRCSPVLAPVSARVRAIGRRAIVEGEHLDTGLVLLADGALEAAEDLALDLADPTGRAHAAWWLRATVPTSELGERLYPGDVYAAVDVTLDAIEGKPMTPTQIETLRRVCLHVAGLTP